jgi:hypothetical protein
MRPIPSRSTVLKSNSKSTFTMPVPPLLVLPIFLIFLVVVVELAGAK